MVSINQQKYIDREEFLREHFKYDPETGSLIWIKRPYRSHVVVGSIAGTKRNDVQLVVSVQHAQLLVHRVAWWFATGEWPKEEIDHINCDSLDNRLCNLREADRAENCFNKRPYSRGGKGLKGAFYHKRDKCWFGQIRHNNQQFHLGNFKTEIDAHLAYCEAAKKLHSEFARTE